MRACFMMKKHVEHAGLLPAGGDPRLVQPDRVKWLAAIGSRVRAAIEFHVPFGYEDERGFHIGAKPVQGESSQYVRIQE